MFPDNVHVAGLRTTLFSSQILDQKFPSLTLAFRRGILKIPGTMTHTPDSLHQILNGCDLVISHF